MSLADALEAAASALPDAADAIRPANGDPERVLEALAPEPAARVAGWLLENRPADAEELVEAWSRSEAGRQVVAGLAADALGKAGRKALRRVLKPDGDLYMFEHTGSRYYPFRAMMNAMTLLSKRIGPDMNRPTVDNVVASGFTVNAVDRVFLDVVKTFATMEELFRLEMGWAKLDRVSEGTALTSSA